MIFRVGWIGESSDIGVIGIASILIALVGAGTQLEDFGSDTRSNPAIPHVKIVGECTTRVAEIAFSVGRCKDRSVALIIPIADRFDRPSAGSINPSTASR